MFGQPGGQFVVYGVGNGLAVIRVDIVVPLPNPWRNLM